MKNFVVIGMCCVDWVFMCGEIKMFFNVYRGFDVGSGLILVIFKLVVERCLDLRDVIKVFLLMIGLWVILIKMVLGFICCSVFVLIM